MRPADPRLVRVLGYVAVAAAVVVPWWMSAGEDREWALWRRYSAGGVALNLGATALILATLYVVRAPARQAARRFARVFVTGFSIGVSFGALELPAALFGHDYRATFGSPETDTWLQLATRVNRFDPELIHVHQPYFRYRGRVRGNLVDRLGIPVSRLYEVDVAYDANGFRNERDFTTADLVAVGDSFVEGAETAHSSTVVAEIGRRVGASIVNLGQSAYGPQQELIALERYGLPLRPAAVVWFFFGGNDLEDAAAYEWRRTHMQEFLAPPPFEARSFTRNALRAFARVTTAERRTVSPAARRHAATFTRADGIRETLYLDSEEGPWAPDQLTLACATLERAHAATNRVGATFMLVYIPRKLRAYRGYLDADPDAYARRWKDNDLPSVLGEWARSRGVSFLDATEPLRSAVAAGESVYLPDDVHWNPSGHRTVARAVARQLAATARLDARQTGRRD